jgi:glutaredoxin-related protein
MGKEVSFTALKALSGKETWPQVFIGGKLIGGSDELAAYFA